MPDGDPGFYGGGAAKLWGRISILLPFVDAQKVRRHHSMEGNSHDIRLLLLKTALVNLAMDIFVGTSGTANNA